ncbi:uracil catabolism protein 4 [Hirsutella rhossiliensis]|uniref:Uracil catabolism protein 4 n=1 Tax=Hirsutella rhossiliensis TaxID=111463 RepID=A0A9P8SN48_9HYPO|nr:uracil catabolism protein 4 [Hirsutella rhossiliensis]KAH0967999.1 uracil catabolism protein 4 [Hirsutella rhossiliensis]
MGLFSRKSKAAKANSSSITISQSSASLNSSNSKLVGTRTSAGTISPRTPLSPMSPVKLPKVDLPRPPDPQLDPTGYLRSLGAVRDRSRLVMDKLLANQLHHFDVDLTKLADVVTFVSGLIKRDYPAPFNSIPGHGRYQHFCVGGKDRIVDLLATWPDSVDNTERCRRLIDLFLVSVLLDAGAGTQWSYKSVKDGRTYRRSEGLAVASLEMFEAGVFSGNPDNKAQVDKSRQGNKLAGLDGRTALLIRLARALNEKRDFFGADGRPGNMIDHLLSHPSTLASSMLVVPLPVLWNVLMNGLALSGSDGARWESILPFHKLTQWLTFSLMQPMQSLLNMHFAGTELLTGLPEYRNGGLFVDMGVLTLKADDNERGLQNYSEYCLRTGTKQVEVAPMFEPGDDVVVEWRGATVGLLDKLCEEVNKSLKAELAGNELTLPQLLEAGSWKGGRELAEIHRPNTKEPPILIESDGTVF